MGIFSYYGFPDEKHFHVKVIPVPQREVLSQDSQRIFSTFADVMLSTRLPAQARTS